MKDKLCQMVINFGKYLWIAHYIKTPLCGQGTHCTVYNIIEYQKNKDNKINLGEKGKNWENRIQKQEDFKAQMTFWSSAHEFIFVHAF